MSSEKNHHAGGSDDSSHMKQAVYSGNIIEVKTTICSIYMVSSTLWHFVDQIWASSIAQWRQNSCPPKETDESEQAMIAEAVFCLLPIDNLGGLYFN